jgi:hypothetical protein
MAGRYAAPDRSSPGEVKKTTHLANADESPEMEASDLTGKTVTLTAGGTTTFTLEQPTAGATLDAPDSCAN